MSIFNLFRGHPIGLMNRQRDNAAFQHLEHKAKAEHHAAMAEMFRKQQQRLDSELDALQAEHQSALRDPQRQPGEPALASAIEAATPIRRRASR